MRVFLTRGSPLAGRSPMQGRRGGRPRRPWILLCRPTLGGRTRQFMPFAALRGYYDLVHAKEVVPEPRRPLADDEARALDGIIANLVRGDVVRCRYYEDGGYRVAEGAVSQIDLTFRDLWIVRRRIPFSAIQSLEMLYPAG